MIDTGNKKGLEIGNKVNFYLHGESTIGRVVAFTETDKVVVDVNTVHFIVDINKVYKVKGRYILC